MGAYSFFISSHSSILSAPCSVLQCLEICSFLSQPKQIALEIHSSEIKCPHFRHKIQSVSVSISSFVSLSSLNFPSVSIPSFVSLSSLNFASVSIPSFVSLSSLNFPSVSIPSFVSLSSLNFPSE